MPKPNTRFLRHIIKDTNTHNSNLLAREAAESKARLEDLEQAEEKKRLKANPESRDIRKRQLGDIAAIIGGGGRKRRRTRDEEEEEGDTSKRPEKRRSGGHGRERSSRRDVVDLFKSRSEGRSKHGRLEREESGGSEPESADRSTKRTSRNKGNDEATSSASADHRAHRRDSRRRSESSSPERRHRKHSHRESRDRRPRTDDEPRSPAQKHRSKAKASKHLDQGPPSEAPRSDAADPSEDSDAPEDLVGPKPPPRYRGRGAVAGTAGIDRRFSESYDPSKDVLQDGGGGGGGGWQTAVDSYREAQKAKLSGQVPPASEVGAGTTDAEEGVKWSKAGETRAWDQDKDKASVWWG